MNFASTTFARRTTRPAFLTLLLLIVVSAGTLWCQMGGGGQGGMLQEKIAALKASTAENQQKLHQYTWTETQQLTLKGDPKPPKEFTCTYGPDGKVQKVPIGAPTAASTNSGGRFKQAKKVSLSRAEGGIVDLVFKDYALPGDSMTIGFDSAAKKIRALHVQSYLDSPQDGVTLTVQFASLPDGTNYAQQTTLNAQAKQLTVVTTNSNYRKIGQ
jgi:hypothetical protein